MEEQINDKEQALDLDKKPIGKVYINMRKLVFDYNQKHKIKLKKEELANFVISKGSPKSRWVSFIRKTKEQSKYELTITELYNLMLFFDISANEFLTKYCKAI
jgi:hypothetical protein